ncbi:MAG: glycosyltransferase family 4 protein [Deltaproteobacteria bacterium]|nr:glycosyltransferase family 4 protein [Deltaproteobacteria bacterium]MBW2024936.1 glycosyltransferase family 4 protein [Deltaproteobacteria bacterium]MBW2124965.1 glycosyltransferase family 4 protein [Deltaproteobacteria bacterium]
MSNSKIIRVLHSFPHRLGMDRICTTAWYEIDMAAAAGADMLAVAGDSVRPFEHKVKVKTTLSRGKLRIPYRLLGRLRACELHDRLVARMLPKLADEIDIIHAWPLGALHTIKAAKRLGIPVALERCNAHTRFAYEVVQRECKRLGVPLPKDHEHAYNESILKREEQEYELADAILCPSDFVVKTFLDKGFPKDKLFRFFYGVDDKVFYPGFERKTINGRPLTMIFVGVCAVRKGLHFALEAWHRSPASRDGTFYIVGDFLPAYREKLSGLLDHPSVRVLGHRNDVPELMRKSDIFVLPSIEEGFGLVCTEAMACGCVPLVSDACTDLCRHMENAMVHEVGDVGALSEHITRLYEDRDLLSNLREAGIQNISKINWDAAGRSLVTAYRGILECAY